MPAPVRPDADHPTPLDALSSSARERVEAEIETLAQQVQDAARAVTFDAVRAAVAEAEARAADRLRAALADSEARAAEHLQAAVAAAETRAAEQLARALADAKQQSAAALDAAETRAAAELRAALDAAERRAADALEAAKQALREEADRQTRRAVEETQADFARRLDEARRLAIEETRAALQREVEQARRAASEEARVAFEHQLAEARRAAAAAAAEVAEARARERQDELANAERLIEAVRALDHAQSLSEILHLLADKAAEVAGRVAILTLEGRTLRTWRTLGFGPALDAAGFQSELDEEDLIGCAVRSGQACTTSSAWNARTPAFVQLRAGRVGFAVPLDVAGQIVAVLYADDDVDEPGRPVPNPWPEVVELLARHAARCLQATTGSRIAEAIFKTEPAHNRAVEDARHEAARRYARLLISEIKLYHERDVAEGRRDGTLRRRLQPAIDRARQLFEARLPNLTPSLRSCFDQELLQTLADGDPGLL